MPKKIDDDYMISEYGNWNVASDYAKSKIMKHLYLADEYETVATFGTSEFLDELQNPIGIDELKIKAFSRLVKTLILVLNNTRFAIRKGEKKEVAMYKDELDRYYKSVGKLYKRIRDVRTGSTSLRLVRENYEPALERVIEIKALMNEPLNKADLIFSHKEEFDYEALKNAQDYQATMVG